MNLERSVKESFSRKIKCLPRQLLVGLLLTSFVASCSKPSKPIPPEPPQPPTYENVTFAPNTTILNMNYFLNYNPNTGDLTLAQSSPQLDSIEVGDFIMVGSSNNSRSGLVRKVISEDGTTFRTISAFPEDAIESAHLVFEKQHLSASDISYAKPLPGVGLPASAENFPFSVPINWNYGPASVTGNAFVDFGFKFGVDISAFKVDSASLTATVRDSIYLDAVLEASGDFTKEIVLFDWFSSPIPAPGVPGLFAVAEVRSSLTFQGNAQAKIEASGGQSAEGHASIVYRRNDPNHWSTPAGFENHFHYTRPVVTANGIVVGALDIDAIINFEGFGGPYLGLGAEISVSADVEKTPWWTADYWFGVNTGFKSGLFRSLSYTKSLYAFSENLGHAESPPRKVSMTAIPDFGRAPLTVAFDGSHSTPFNEIIKYTISDGMGHGLVETPTVHLDGSYDLILSTTYDTAGTFPVKAYFKFSDGQTLAVEDTVVVEAQPKPGLEGLITFSSVENGNGNSDIFTIKPDGTDKRNVTASNAERDFFPSWSPDGQIIYSSALGSLNYRDYNIYLISSQGGVKSPLTTDRPALNLEATFSPNGRKIVYVDRNERLMEMDYPSLTTSVLVDQFSNINSPTWLPDGSKIAFVAPAPNEGLYSLYTIKSDGSNLERFSSLSIYGYIINDVEWSPNINKFAVSMGKESENPQIYVVDLAVSDFYNVSNQSTSINRTPTWSPDGEYLIYTSIPGSTYNSSLGELWRVKVDGSENVRLTNDSFSNENPKWSR